MRYTKYVDSLNIDSVLKIVALALGAIIWFLRLEGKVNYQEKQINKLEVDQQEIQKEIQLINSDILKQLSEIKKSIARIEGRLSVTDDTA